MHFDHHDIINDHLEVATAGSLPDSLLRDIRGRSLKFNDDETEEDEVDHVDLYRHQHMASKEAKLALRTPNGGRKRVDIFATQHLGSDYEDDKFYSFHINERIGNGVSEDGETDSMGSLGATADEDESFAGYKELKGLGQHSAMSTIRSSKGTVRGVKNRVRNGIATFLQMQHAGVKVSAKFFFILN